MDGRTDTGRLAGTTGRQAGMTGKQASSQDRQGRNNNRQADKKMYRSTVKKLLRTVTTPTWMSTRFEPASL